MSAAREIAQSRAREMPIDPSMSPRQIARELHDAAVKAVNPAPVERLSKLDRDFDARVDGLRDSAGTADERARTVTPWPDFAASIAAAVAAAYALGAGRLTGPASDSTAAVSPVVVAAGIGALVLVIVGALVARRERSVLRAQRENSSSVTRDIILGATTGLAFLASVAMVVRVVADPLGTAIVAGVVAAVLFVVLIPIFVGARRESASGAARGTAIPRTGGSPERRAKYALASAEEDAQDEARAILGELEPAALEQIDAAYAAAVSVVVARGGMTHEMRQRLRRGDALVARYSA